MTWLDNLKSIAANKKAGTCPYCHSDNTDYGFTVLDEETHTGYGAIWCNECRHAFHMSPPKILDDMKIVEIPKDLKYQLGL